MVLVKARKQELIGNFKMHEADTGSSVVQIALLTERINQLSNHFKLHKRDYNSRRGLLTLVGRRRRLLNYFKKADSKKYEELIKRLDLRK